MNFKPSTVIRLLEGLLLAAIALAPAFLNGCASVKALPAGSSNAETLLRPPSTIYIRPFETGHGMWQGQASAPEERTRVRDWLSAELEAELKQIAPTRLLTGAETPNRGWLVTGRFVRVNPGSKVQRMFLGLGSGGSKLETVVTIYDLAVSTAQPVLSIETTGGSNLEGGAAALVNNAQLNDITRTAREVREFIQGRLWSDETPATRARPAGQSLEAVEIGARAPRK